MFFKTTSSKNTNVTNIKLPKLRTVLKTIYRQLCITIWRYLRHLMASMTCTFYEAERNHNRKSICHTSYLGHYQKYHNTFCLSSKILAWILFYFLSGPLQVPRANENNFYAKFWRKNEEYAGICECGLLAWGIRPGTSVMNYGIGDSSMHYTALSL